MTAAEAWVRSVKPAFEFEVQKVVDGDIHGWGDLLLVAACRDSPSYVQKMRAERDALAAGISKLFAQWRQSGRIEFKTRIATECRGYAERLLQDYAEWLRHRLNVVLHIEPMIEASLIVPAVAVTFDILADVMKRNGVPSHNAKVVEFFRSGALVDVPFLRIAASLFSVLATKAAAGQKKPPNRGTVVDVNMVASLLPYCDAMFIDNACASHIDDIPRAHKLSYSSRIFSPRTGRELLEYLAGLHAAMTQAHRDLVATLYGANWEQPNMKLFDGAQEPGRDRLCLEDQ